MSIIIYNYWHMCIILYKTFSRVFTATTAFPLSTQVNKISGLFFEKLRWLWTLRLNLYQFYYFWEAYLSMTYRCNDCVWLIFILLLLLLLRILSSTFFMNSCYVFLFKLIGKLNLSSNCNSLIMDSGMLFFVRLIN